jgi:hypothetical protein
VAKYRKKIITIDAVQITAEMFTSQEARQKAFGGLVPEAIWDNGVAQPWVMIRHATGNYAAAIGDWIITGLDGEVYVCPADKFERCYEPA